MLDSTLAAARLAERQGGSTMDLRFSAEELAFRDELRAFIRDNLPTDIRDKMRLGYRRRKGRHDPLAAHPQQEGLGRL